MTDRPATIATTLSVPSRISKCIRILAGMYAHSWGVRYRRRFRSGRVYPKDWQQPLHVTPMALLQGCGADLRTAFCRMECRFDAVPFVYSHVFGPCFQADYAKGILHINTRTRASMTDTESFQKERPKATVFDEEIFHLGWEAGAKWAESTVYRKEKGENPRNPPDSAAYRPRGN